MQTFAWYHKLDPAIAHKADSVVKTKTGSEMKFAFLTIPEAQEWARALARTWAGVKIHPVNGMYVVSLPVLFRGVNSA
jgi:hypothetical protein